jgi:predicted phage terminase large subunit-like protein
MDRETTRARLEHEALALAQAELRERARDDLLAFTLYSKPDYQVNWHHRVLCSYLDKFARREIKRLMVFMPPRNGKSEQVSRRLPAYLLGREPDASIIATSYSADLASAMNRDVQRIIDAPEYSDLFPNTKLSGSNIRTVATGSWLRNSDIFEVVGRRGIYRSAGVGGGITGMGAQFAIIDDPIKNQQEADSAVYRESIHNWYNSTLYTRLEKDACVLLTVTRWHEDDLAGRLLDLAEKDPDADQWTVLSFPALSETVTEDEHKRRVKRGYVMGLDPRKEDEALWPWKYPLKRLKGIRATAGTRVWTSLYQQRPSAAEGTKIKRAWWKYFKQQPEHFDEIIQSWDMAFKDSKGSDYVVGQVWGRKGANKYLLDQTRDRLDFPATLKALELMTAKHKKAITKLVEDKANGPAVISTLKNEIAGMIPVDPKSSKEARVAAVSPEIESGNVYLPDPSIAPWIKDFVDECASFPKGANDDQVDAMTQALLRFQNGAGEWPADDEKKKPPSTVAPGLKSGDRW